MGGLGARITQGKLKLKSKDHPVVGPFFQVGNSDDWTYFSRTGFSPYDPISLLVIQSFQSYRGGKKNSNLKKRAYTWGWNSKS